MASKIAVLDDYQGVALQMADWSAVAARAQLDIYSDHLADADAVVTRLLPYDVVCVMRERTPFPRRVLERLPNLRLITTSGMWNASVDLAGCEELGITVSSVPIPALQEIEQYFDYTQWVAEEIMPAIA